MLEASFVYRAVPPSQVLLLSSMRAQAVMAKISERDEPQTPHFISLCPNKKKVVVGVGEGSVLILDFRRDSI